MVETASILEERVTFIGKPTVISFIDDPRFEVPDIANFYRLKDVQFILKGKVDGLITEHLNEDNAHYLRAGGLGVARIKKSELPMVAEPESPEAKTLRFAVSLSKEILLRQDEDYIYLIFMKKSVAKFSAVRYEKLIRFLFSREVLKIKPVEEFPKARVKKKAKNEIIILTEEEIAKIYRELLAEKNGKEEEIIRKSSFEIVSLAPPKDGHILQMIAAGMADGKYGNLVIKGTTEIQEVTEPDEEDPEVMYVTEVPVTKIIALDLVTKELLEIA